MDDKQHALAVLVSGQLVRFFREGLSPLAHLSPPVDLHVVLARTEYTRAGSSAAVSPEPSLNHLSEAALAERLQAMGFRHASARILSESVLDAEMRAIDAAVVGQPLEVATSHFRRFEVYSAESVTDSRTMARQSTTGSMDGECRRELNARV